MNRKLVALELAEMACDVIAGEGWESVKQSPGRERRKKNDGTYEYRDKPEGKGKGKGDGESKSKGVFQKVKDKAKGLKDKVKGKIDDVQTKITDKALSMGDKVDTPEKRNKRLLNRVVIMTDAGKGKSENDTHHLDWDDDRSQLKLKNKSTGKSEAVDINKPDEISDEHKSALKDMGHWDMVQRTIHENKKSDKRREYLTKKRDELQKKKK
jgi:hypothetical protein